MNNRFSIFYHFLPFFKKRSDHFSPAPLRYYISYGLKNGRNEVNFTSTIFQNREASK